MTAREIRTQHVSTDALRRTCFDLGAMEARAALAKRRRRQWVGMLAGIVLGLLLVVADVTLIWREDPLGMFLFALSDDLLDVVMIYAVVVAACGWAGRMLAGGGR